MTKYHAFSGQWGTWMSWRLKCIIYMHRMFPIDTSTSPLPDLPSMFGWKVQTARKAQQASEEVRCWGWVHTLHQNDPKCISSFLHCPRARSCCWHGAINDNMIHMMQLRCYACERSDTHTHTFTCSKALLFLHFALDFALDTHSTGRWIWSFVLGFDNCDKAIL